MHTHVYNLSKPCLKLNPKRRPHSFEMIADTAQTDTLVYCGKGNQRESLVSITCYDIVGLSLSAIAYDKMIPNPNVVGTIQLKKHDRRKDVPKNSFPCGVASE
jgi:hypothetical protein